MGPGDVIAERYRIERLLGSGGMGAVWAATHLVTQKPVALKQLKPQENDENARQRVLREARAACAVRHPSVVTVHDVIAAGDGSPVLVMDLLDGEPLRARLERDRTLPLAEALKIAETVLEALDVAHAAGIVHRDLKPENLFLLRDGRVMLLDFGVAKLVKADGPAAGPGTLTATGAMVGTPFYMAPEQAFGEPIDGRADLWAAGIVLFECLAGEPPTRGENLGQVLRILSTGKVAKLRDRAPEVPGAIASVVDGLLAIDANDRPATARAALDTLRVAANDGAVPAASTQRLNAPALSTPPAAATIAERPTLAAPSRARRIAFAAVIGLASGVATTVIAVRGRPREPAVPIAAASTQGAPPIVTTPTATATPLPEPEQPVPTPSTKPTAAAPRPVKSARPTASASALPPASTAPRLLTDVPF